MQFAELKLGVTAYRDVGPKAAPVVLLAHPLGMNQNVWDALIPRLVPDFRLVSWDLPGHGASQPVAGPVSAEAFALQAIALLDFLDIQRAHFVGTSIGGIIGQALLLTASTRLGCVILTNTGASIGQPDAWRQRADRVRALGLRTLAAELVDRWFGPRFKTAHAPAVRGWEIQLSRCDAESYARLCELLAHTNFHHRLGGVHHPASTLAGAADVAAPPAIVRALAGELPGATFATLDDVAHVPSVEAPEAFAGWLRNALSQDAGATPATYEDGLATRRRVLGDEHVARAARNATTLDAPFQNLITRFAWGELWGNPDLAPRVRSLVTLAILAALGRDAELGLHLEAAKRTGVGEAELRQALSHVAVYAGVPAANHAFKLAKEHGWGSPHK